VTHGGNDDKGLAFKFQVFSLDDFLQNNAVRRKPDFLKKGESKSEYISLEIRCVVCIPAAEHLVSAAAKHCYAPEY